MKVDCKVCDGTGHIFKGYGSCLSEDSYEECPICQGSGSVEVKDDKEKQDNTWNDNVL